MIKTRYWLLVVVLCMSFSSDLQKKTVRQDGYDIECYIELKEPNSLNSHKMYYWFKSGQIHQSLSTIGGYVLHGNFVKYYRSNQLAEKGNFSHGLKTGIWRSWHENGLIKEQEIWKNGYKQGNYYNYNSKGELILAGSYRRNKKIGRWINYTTKDTIYYKKGVEFDKKPLNLIQRLVRKKDSIEKAHIRFEKIQKKKTDSINKAKHKKERLLKKRNDSISKAKEKIRKTQQKKLDSIKKAKNTKQTFFNKLFKNSDMPKKQNIKK